MTACRSIDRVDVCVGVLISCHVGVLSVPLEHLHRRPVRLHHHDAHTPSSLLLPR